MSSSQEQPVRPSMPAIRRMPASVWLDYLQAMDITPWVAKENLPTWKQALALSADAPAPEPSSGEQAAIEPVAPSATQVVQPKPAFVEPDAKPLQPAENSIQKMPTTPTEMTELKPLWVKPVNWRSAKGQSVYGETLQGETVSLRIICRHSADQPAASFASKNGPSRFMLDYLQAMQWVLQPDFQLRISLFHLAEAGLSEQCQPLTENLYVGADETTSADKGRAFIWLMGESAVNSLLGDTTIAASRLRLHQCAYGPQPIICSYHPYDLISHPAIKKLVPEDFQFLKTCLSTS